jgi:hypothetical protein
MDFSLDKEQEMFKKSVEEFARKEILPGISRSKTFCQPLKNQRFSASYEFAEALKEADKIMKSRFRPFQNL